MIVGAIIHVTSKALRNDDFVGLLHDVASITAISIFITSLPFIYYAVNP